MLVLLGLHWGLGLILGISDALEFVVLLLNRGMFSLGVVVCGGWLGFWVW